MNGSRSKIIVLAVFLLTLGAGMTAGILAARLPRPSDGGVQKTGESPLAAELGLTPEQSAQMQKIWESVRDISAGSLSRGIAAQQARDGAVRALIPADKVDEFNKIERTYAENMAAMKGRRESAFKEAVEASKKILTDSQRKKYEEILTKRLGADGENGHDPLGQPAEGGPVSQPSF